MKRTTYEYPHQGYLWRVEAEDEYQNRPCLNFRRWYLKNGEGTRTKAGFKMPPGTIPDLIAGLEAAMATLALDGLPDSSSGQR